MRLLALLGALTLVVLACTPPPPEKTPTRAGIDPSAWAFNEAEKAWIETRKTGGGLRVASTELEGAYLSTPQGPVGFHADLARGFGAFLGLPVTFRSVPFSTYFSRDGSVPDEVKTDPRLQYEPDVFHSADLAAFNFSDLPWRRQLMDFHAVFPTRVVLVTMRGHEIRQLSELSGRRIVVFANTSHELYMRRLRADLGLRFDVIAVPFETDLFAYLKDGKADAMVRDANGVMLLLQKNTDFNVTLPLMSTEWSNWAVSKTATVLGGLVDKYLLKVRAEGGLEALWQKAYGLSFDTYNNLIGDDPPLVWTEAEQAVVERLKRTGLRAAIDAEQTIYEPQPDGSARGLTYNLLLEVAKRLEVPLRLRTTAFHEYFDAAGRFPDTVKTDPQFVYRPDLLDRVDLYADTFSPLDWRRKFLGFVSLYPSKLVWLVRKEASGGAGVGKVAVLAESSYLDWLEGSAGLKPGAVVLTKSGDEAVRMVVEGRADRTVSDANLALGWLAKYPGITFFPADQAVQDLSWAVDKQDEGLRQVLNKVLNALRYSGAFSQLWLAYYHVSLDEYLGLLAADQAP